MKNKYNDDNSPVPHAKTLKKVPPLMHRQTTSAFFISKSQIVRFVLFAMNLNPVHRLSWKKAFSVFNEARKKRVIQFDHETLTWSGVSYRPGMNDPRISELVRKAKTWKPKDRKDRKDRKDPGKNKGDKE